MTIPTDPLFAATQRALAGQYSLERELGRGGMGVVYLAREVELDRYVALKVLPPNLASDGQTRARFLREARVAASLSHPHVVPIYRVGEAHDVVYFSMAFVDGETLGERLRTRGPLAPSIATRLLREVAQALGYSHGRGVIHRDIKPDNILIERESGRALVSDFGIAAAPLDTADDGRVMGTVHFMSPEQSAGAPVDERSDLYSLGVVGFLALSGKLPRSGQSLAAVSPVTPAHLVRAIDRATCVEPTDRYSSAEAFASALESAVATRAELPPPLREWLDAEDPWRVPYFMWSAMMLVVGAYQSAHGAQAFDTLGTVVAAFIPLLPAALFQLRIAGRAFSAGYTADDLRAAIAAWRAQQSEFATVRRATPWWHDVARLWSWSSVAMYVSVLLGRGGAWQRWAVVHPRLLVPLILSGLFGLPVLTALGVPVLPSFLSLPKKSLAEKFWTSKLGDWTERHLMRGRQRAVATSTFRATEHVLGSAVDVLYQALPTAFREQLRELPSVVTRLESLAKDARGLMMHFEGVTAVARDTELSNARETARRQLTESVSALETIRLDLLRLSGGDADLRPTTTILDAARRIDSDLRRLRAARSETERTLRPLGLDLRPPTPA